MSNDHESRITKLEAAISSSLPRIEKFMENGVELRVANAENIVALKEINADILEKVMDFRDYQKACDKEREDHGKRLDGVEGFQKRQIKMSIGAGLFVGFLANDGGAKLVKKVLELF